MNAIKPLAQTQDTVTLRRADFDALLYSIQDAADLAAVDAHRAYEDRVGWETARQNYLTAGEARRLLDGDSPVRVWREKRRVKQVTLARAARISPSYLAEIEGGKKPGSSAALRQLADVLEMPVDILIGTGSNASGLRPVSRADAAAKRLIALASEGCDQDRMEQEVRAIIGEWGCTAALSGLQHQMRAGIEMLVERLADALRESDAKAAGLERDGEYQTAEQTRTMTRALGRAIDAAKKLYDEG